MRVTDNDFQCEVLEKLARLEAKMEMLVGSGQPGRISLIETKVSALERNDVRRGVYDRLVNAAIGPRARDDELSVRWVRIDPQPGVVGNVGAGAHLLSPNGVAGGSWGGQRQRLARFVVVEGDPEATCPLLTA